LIHYLKDRYNGKGDVPNDKGLCDFLGNLNVIVFKLKLYLNIIEEKKGLAQEFVNPKYTDETRTKFKHPSDLNAQCKIFLN
jgi:UDP-sugar pyrophosphorylase